MDYYFDVVRIFLGFECVRTLAVYGGSESGFQQADFIKNVNLFLEDELMSYRFEI